MKYLAILVTIAFSFNGKALAQGTLTQEPHTATTQAPPAEQKDSIPLDPPPENSALSEKSSEVDIACAPEAEEAKCGTKTAGKGLVSCIKRHKDKTSGFKISKPCKKAMLKLQRAAKAKKHERAKK